MPQKFLDGTDVVAGLQQMSGEGVSEGVAALVLADRADSELEYALAPIPEREGRILRVVYDRRVDPVRVVTAFFDRTMRGKL